MMPSKKNTKRVAIALDQAYEKFTQLEDESTDEAEIVAYRCYYTNIYESKLYVEQMQKEIDRLKAEKENAIKEIEERRAFNLKCDGQPEWLRKGVDVGLNTALDILKGKECEQE